MLQNRKGFTLIELMIVVAIIGILAAVAIPGFMTYIKNSKTSEAKTNLDAIKKGALAYYEAEHYDETGLTASSKQYPNTGKLETIGAKPTAETIGVKQSPVGLAFGSAPWSELNFKLTSPFYYGYAYDADGKEFECKTTGTAPDTVTTCTLKKGAKFEQSHFQATACASLNVATDSVFYINGYSDGSVSPVIEGTAATHCYKAKAPVDPGTSTTPAA